MTAPPFAFAEHRATVPDIAEAGGDAAFQGMFGAGDEPLAIEGIGLDAVVLIGAVLQDRYLHFQGVALEVGTDAPEQLGPSAQGVDSGSWPPVRHLETRPV
jgi:hypothetical protein